MWDSIQQLIRIVLQLAAGYLVGQGVIAGELVETFIGGGMSLAAIAWWVIWERKRQNPQLPHV